MLQKLFKFVFCNGVFRILIGFMLINLNSLNVTHAQEINTKNASELRINRLSIQINGGIGYLNTNTKNDNNQGIPYSDKLKYYNDLKSGNLLQGALFYRINPKWSIGIENQTFHTQSSISGSIIMNGDRIAGNYSFSDQWNHFYGLVNENIYTNFSGLSLKRHVSLIEEKFEAYALTSLGWILYRNEYNNVIFSRLLTGNAPALNLQTGFELKLHNNLKWNINASYLASYLFKLKINNGKGAEEMALDIKELENLSRVNLTTGLNFYF